MSNDAALITRRELDVLLTELERQRAELESRRAAPLKHKPGAGIPSLSAGAIFSLSGRTRRSAAASPGGLLTLNKPPLRSA